MRSEGERHEHLRRWEPNAHRHDNNYRDERRHRAIYADEGGEERHEQADRDEQSRTAFASALYGLLPGPGRHPRRIERLAHHKETRDKDHCGVAESGE